MAPEVGANPLVIWQLLIQIPAGAALILGVPVAWLRLAMKPPRPHLLPTRLSGEELRFALGFVVIQLAVTLVVVLALVPVILLAPLMPFPAGAVIVIMHALQAYIWARLGPGLAMSYQRERFNPFGSWGGTRAVRLKLCVVWVPPLIVTLVPVVLDLVIRTSENSEQAITGSPTSLILVAAMIGASYTLVTGWFLTTHAHVAKWIMAQDNAETA